MEGQPTLQQGTRTPPSPCAPLGQKIQATMAENLQPRARQPNSHSSFAQVLPTGNQGGALDGLTHRPWAAGELGPWEVAQLEGA